MRGITLCVLFACVAGCAVAVQTETQTETQCTCELDEAVCLVDGRELGTCRHGTCYRMGDAGRYERACE